MSIDAATRSRIAFAWQRKAEDVIKTGRVMTADEEMDVIIEAYEAAKADQPTDISAKKDQVSRSLKELLLIYVSNHDGERYSGHKENPEIPRGVEKGLRAVLDAAEVKYVK